MILSTHEGKDWFANITKLRGPFAIFTGFNWISDLFFLLENA
jgi:hypothetical protein